MMPNRINLLLRQFYKRPPTWNRLCSTVPQAADEKDPAPLFFEASVQELLTTLTRIDYRIIFSSRKDGTRLQVPKFKFMTEEELQNARLELASKARGRIQMPPVVKMRSDKVKVLSKDPAIQGNGTNNVVFTDISFGGNNRERLIVVREPNGLLRHATCNERHRMNQIYFPISGRELHTPKMFHNPHFSDLLDKEEFEFILDRACLQFEPDDPEYHRVTKEVYSYVNSMKKFDWLRSTRHFGPLAFYLAWENKIDTLLLDLIESEHIEEAGALIRLYHKLQPEFKSAQDPVLNDVELIRIYAEVNSPERLKIMSAIDVYEKLQREKREIDEGIMKAHGLIDNEDKQPEV